MKRISIIILVLVATLASCKKTPEVNLKYVDVERDLITVGTTTATVQCDYQYITTLKKANFYYGEGQDEADMNTAEMRVVQNTLYVDLTGLRANTTYSYYYEFHNGFNSMRTAVKTFKTEASPTTVTLPTVVTASVTEITTNSAKGGGEVTNDGGAEVTERGICWSTSENPSLSDNHVAAGTGMGAFTAMMDNLEANTTYHVRAYATNEKGTAYGLDREFVTDNGGGCDCGYVDLGLPSGTLWATCNVGANTPEEYGDYFAWGETEPKSVYEWSNYKYCNGDEYQLTKYCDNSHFGYNGFTDTLTILQSIDDAATANWGNDWCMPTREQWEELYDNTSSIWTTQNDIEGRLYIASNGNSLFLPATFTGEAKNSDRDGIYWTRTRDEDSRFGKPAIFSYWSPFHVETIGYARCYGLSVRPVRKTEMPTPPSNVPEGAINGLFTINAEGDQVYFSQGNLQYQASTNTWKFAENQWDYVGEDNSHTSPTNSGWIDLFCWGTSGWNNGNTYYHPWDYESIESCDLGWGYGPTDGTNYTYDLNGAYVNADWGVYNPISNGGNVPNQWRTLTSEEWAFVFTLRNTASGIHYAKAQLNGVNGMILLPDNWSVNAYSFSNPDQNEVGFNSNVINGIQWNLLEAEGAIFLPAAGRRGGDLYVSDLGTMGEYWSASYYEDILCGAWVVRFYDAAFGANESHNRCMGQSVRLVQDAN